MAIIPIHRFETNEPFFLVRFTGRCYPLVGPVRGTGPKVAKSLLLREPQYYRGIEEKARGDTDEATAIVEGELSCQIDGQWIALPTADGRIRIRYNTGYILCTSYVTGEVPSSEDISRLLDQPSNLTDIIHNTAHLSLEDGKREWWVNILSVSADEFATVLEKEASRHLRRPVTVCYGPVMYYDSDNLPVHRECNSGRLREIGSLYYFDKKESYSVSRNIALSSR